MRRARTRVGSALVAAMAAGGLALGGGGAAGAARVAARPNILFVILDDVGIDQLALFGFGGEPAAKTPNLAKIARQGVMFTNVWAMPECSPSRAAYFTGRYPLRTGVVSAIVGNHLPQDYVSPYEATLPRVLATAGYTSALIGKYHLGNDKDPAGNCAPATRGWDFFAGNMPPGPPSIDTTAGGADPSGAQTCGYFQTPAPGACYSEDEGTPDCLPIAAGEDPGTSPARACLQGGGLFRPTAACGVDPPSIDDFARSNGYYVWPETHEEGPASPDFVDDAGEACGTAANRGYMTAVQSERAVAWWNQQVGRRMLTLSYNTMHTPFQKAPTDLVPDPLDLPLPCSSLLPPRQLLNNMLEAADTELGRTLAAMGLGTLEPDGRGLATLDLRDTVIVVVGDNGSYGPTVRATEGFSISRSKATVYQTGVWVPLIVAGPTVHKPARKVDALVNVTDLFQLFGELAGIDVAEVVPPSHTLDSQSLLPYLVAPATRPVRRTSFTQLAAGTFTPAPEERSWPCLIGTFCNDTLLFSQALCEDNGGTWYGPGAATQLTSCCALAAASSGQVSVTPLSQLAVRDKRYKLVEVVRTDCSSPLPPDAASKPFPWAEYATTTSRELYDLKPTAANPLGLDPPDGDLLQQCSAGESPAGCLPRGRRAAYDRLANELLRIKESASAEETCRAKGDGNLDLRVDQADIAAWAHYRDGGPSQYDINEDAQTDDLDLGMIEANLGTDCLDPCARADLDRNGRVSSRDLELLVAQLGPCNPVLCSGDLDGNGVVDVSDVAMMNAARSSCRP